MPEIAVTPDQRERLRWIQRRLQEDVAYGHVRPCDALDYLLDHADATGGLSELDAAVPDDADVERAGTDQQGARDDGSGADESTEEQPAGAGNEQSDGAASDEPGGAAMDVGAAGGAANGSLPSGFHTSTTANVVRIGSPTGGSGDADGEDSDDDADATEDQVDADDAGVEGIDDTDEDGGAATDGDEETGDGDDADGEDEHEVDDEDEHEATEGDDGDADADEEAAVGGDKDDGDSGSSTLNSMMSLLETHDDKWREAGGGEEKYEVDLPDGTTEGARTKDDVRAVLFKQYR
jgi:hypothetical protein